MYSEKYKPLKKCNVKGIYIQCTKCKKTITNSCGLNGRKIGSCKHLDKNKYKLRVCVPGKNNIVRTKFFDTRDPNELVIQAYQYRLELEKCDYQPSITKIETSIPKTVVEVMAHYIAYLNNETPHEQEHKERSKGHIKEVERYFMYFVDYLKSVKTNANHLPILKLDRNVVGQLKSYILETKKFAPKTYNKYIGLMRVFIEYSIREFDLNMKNPFTTFKSLSAKTNINTISKEEFKELMVKITPENGICKYENRTNQKIYSKSFYKPWLKNAIILALLTGRRREEIVTMKFNGILENENGEPYKILIQDYKVNKSKGISTLEDLKMVHIPVISSLKNLLMELGYEKYKGKDEYILAPEETMQRNTMMNFISKAFSHYYNQLNTGKDLRFYDLRKTYISHLFAKHGNKARIITKHSSDEVMLNHYIDEKVISEVVLDFEFFDL